MIVRAFAMAAIVVAAMPAVAQDEYRARLADAESRSEQLAIIAEAAERAETMSSRGESAQAAALYEFCGHTYYTLEELNASKAAFQQLAASQGVSRRSLDAMRMLGQISVAEGEYAAAESWYSTALDTIARNPELATVENGGLIEMCAFGLAKAASVGRRDWGYAAGVLALVTEEYNELIRPQRVLDALVQRARAHAKAGQRAQAIQCWDRFLARYEPRTGAEAVFYRTERAELFRRADSNADYIGELLVIWQDGELAQYHQIAYVGNELSRVLWESGDSEGSLGYARQVAQLIDDKRQDWLAQDSSQRARWYVDQSLACALTAEVRAAERSHHFDVGIEAGERLQREFADMHLAPDRLLDRLRQKLEASTRP